MKTRIAIVGGGPSGLSTAWHLLHNNPKADQLEVTIYSMGWRAGGKGATGRGVNGRIQEHGIHGFMGFYWNSTIMLHNAYHLAFPKDQPTPATDAELPTRLHDALIRNDYMNTLTFDNGHFTNRESHAPVTGGKPWEGPIVPTKTELAQAFIGLIIAAIRHQPPTEHELKHGRAAWLINLGRRVSHSRLCRELERLAKEEVVKDHYRVLQELDHIAKRFLDRAFRGERHANHVFVALDYYATLVRGMFADRILEVGVEVDSFDNENYIEWLQRHGIHELTLRSSLPHSPALICFQFLGGDTTQAPELSAASYISWMVRCALMKGAPTMFFRSGTGEAVIRPLYDALVKLGVRFEFFHKLSDVVPSENGDMVDELTFCRQARLADGVERYEPLVHVPGRQQRAWPAEPDWSQLHPDDAAGIQQAEADLESYWTPWPGAGSVHLRRGEHFDQVVLAVPPSVFPYACPKLVEKSPVLASAQQGLPTTATLSAQLWFDKTIEELGWTSNVTGTELRVGASFPNPLNGIADFSEIIQFEGWSPDDRPKTLLYLCGPFPDLVDPLKQDFADHRWPEFELERGRAITAQFMAASGGWLPKAAGDRPSDPLGLDFSLLHGTKTGIRRIEDQYVKVNIDPSERYVLSPRGSAKARPRAWDAEAQNLVLAGDWIYTGINIGSFEGATTSGMLAAHALTGFPVLGDVHGYGIFHPGAFSVVVKPRIA